LVAINIEATSQYTAQRGEIVQINRNLDYVNFEYNILVSYDEWGNRIETQLDEAYINYAFPDSNVVFDESLASPSFDMDAAIQFDVSTSSDATHDFAPLFNTGAIWVNVPRAQMPTPAFGISVLVGGRFHQTNSSHTHVDFRTFAFPAGMRTIDVYITNQIGDCFITVLNVPPSSQVSHLLNWPGEPYGARVSSIDGSFNGVPLQFSARSAPVHPTISFPNFNGFTTGRADLNVRWNTVPGARYYISMRNLTNNMVVFRNRAAGTSTNFTIHHRYLHEGHEYRIAVEARVGNTSTWGERTFRIGLSNARQTIINRARNMNDYGWFTPAGRRLVRWGGSSFPDFEWIHGIPYSQTVNQVSCRRSVVHWNVGNARYFEESIRDWPDRFFSASWSGNGTRQPMYGSDCSGYMSVAFNIARHTTHAPFSGNSFLGFHDDTWFPQVGRSDETPLERMARLSPGDTLNSPGRHCVIVYSITPIVNSQGVTTNLRIVTLEQTPPISTRMTRYALGYFMPNGYIGRAPRTALRHDNSWRWTN